MFVIAFVDNLVHEVEHKVAVGADNLRKLLTFLIVFATCCQNFAKSHYSIKRGAYLVTYIGDKLIFLATTLLFLLDGIGKIAVDGSHSLAIVLDAAVHLLEFARNLYISKEQTYENKKRQERQSHAHGEGYIQVATFAQTCIIERSFFAEAFAQLAVLFHLAYHGFAHIIAQGIVGIAKRLCRFRHHTHLPISGCKHGVVEMVIAAALLQQIVYIRLHVLYISEIAIHHGAHECKLYQRPLCRNVIVVPHLVEILFHLVDIVIENINIEIFQSHIPAHFFHTTVVVEASAL